MPKEKSNYDQIKEYLNDTLPYLKFSQQEQAFFDDFEEDLADAMDKMDLVDRTSRDIIRYQNLKRQYDANQRAVDHEKEQIAKAHLVKDKLQTKYDKIGWFARTFSHLIPNSLTAAGRLRNEMKACDKAYKDCGYNPKSIESRYHRNEQIKGGDDGTLMDYQEKDQAMKSAFTKKGKEEKLRELAARSKIGSQLDSDKFVADKQKVTIVEAAGLPVQGQEFIQQEQAKEQPALNVDMNMNKQ